MRDLLWYETYLDLDNLSESRVSTAVGEDLTLPSLAFIHLTASPHREEAEGITPQEVEGITSQEVEGITPQELEGITSQEVDCITSQDVEGLALQDSDIISPHEGDVTNSSSPSDFPSVGSFKLTADSPDDIHSLSGKIDKQ